MVLAQLSPGQSARIKHMNHLERTLRRKLMVMGLLPQTEVLFLRAAPLGDPLQIQCQGICLSMQKSLALQIEVELV
ncbi:MULTISPECIES: FeoA family protein [Aeromonas]|jgi:ferrous iron transport protein A|uniref:Ferrous iron transport protein A n=8 Tax=Bacteria TaxID=2 RepID=A0A3L0W2U3_ECOLX|nr:MULTISPECIES: FeoA family protein [Aeromonas]MBP6384218.1 ferrous iron transport protein A [Aeromonas sp.]ABO89712.1 ferrous iron transport protein A [Aeromonas salmonicida subsp. salmonicida A449]ARW81597.1 Ferrous iron transport protein A [Aeromonas salmonicida]ASI23870.1 ferrous iron transport protein A [Aeromonas salmonicida]ASI28190.1 ferrous iron transport protein A [Aeromonas salmonicida]